MATEWIFGRVVATLWILGRVENTGWMTHIEDDKRRLLRKKK